MRITLCGSSKFYEKLKEIADDCSRKGHQCLLPEPLMAESEWAAKYGREELLKRKPLFTQGHFQKIENSDAILVVNLTREGIEGYFGSNTLMEIAVAFYLGKKIFWLNPFGEDHPHYEEIAGLDATILNGDLNKIK